MYVCDKKNKGLVTAPFQVTDLVTEAEVELKFTAPKKPGLYTFTVVLRSDAYLGFDQSRDIKVRKFEWINGGGCRSSDVGCFQLSQKHHVRHKFYLDSVMFAV